MKLLELKLVLFAAALVLVSAANAQTTQRVRGTITAFDGGVLEVRTRDGKDLKVELTEKASVATAKSMALADLKPGEYVGSATTKRADGVLVALEVHTIPRSVAEGYGPWDLQPGSMMTNANVVAIVQTAEGQELTVEHKGGPQRILVPPGTPIVTTVAADRSFLKPGEYVFFGAEIGADGRVTTSGRIQVSKDGVKPPQ